ncbi:MAG: hypothetical protein ACI8ZN_002099 [Bacteroidia bacterium]|jgi:hypothetical protein
MNITKKVDQKGAKLIVIWDYDTPISRITATKPYKYQFDKCLQEEKNVAKILEVAEEFEAEMTFAVVGYGAEQSVYPFDVRHVIKQIRDKGHEVASHSWKHEWFPYLTKYQIEHTLKRSKLIIEQTIGEGHVTGFVPPHDKPYSWLSKFAWSKGDRALYPFHPGADIGYIAGELNRQNYTWYRVRFRSIWNKLVDWEGIKLEKRLTRPWIKHKGTICFNATYNGFDERALQLMDQAVKTNAVIVVVGHPAALSWKGPESMDCFQKLMEHASSYKKDGKLEFFTVQDYINEYINQ